MAKGLTKHAYKPKQSVLAFCLLTGKLNTLGTTFQGAVCFQCENRATALGSNPLNPLIMCESHVHLVQLGF